MLEKLKGTVFREYVKMATVLCPLGFLILCLKLELPPEGFTIRLLLKPAAFSAFAFVDILFFGLIHVFFQHARRERERHWPRKK